MGHWGKVACQVIEVEPERRLVFTFDVWTITWRLEAEGTGTRMFLEQAGIDLDDPKGRYAFESMGRGWRDDVLPRLGALLGELGRRSIEP